MLSVIHLNWNDKSISILMKDSWRFFLSLFFDLEKSMNKFPISTAEQEITVESQMQGGRK